MNDMEKDADSKVEVPVALASESELTSGGQDVAARFLARLDPAIMREPISAKEARRVLWKLDLILLPMMGITTIVAAIDKVIISNASIYGMLEDNHMDSAQFSWMASIFYFSYLTFEYPASLLLQRLNLRLFFLATVFGWVVLTFCTGATSSFAALAVVRFLMGGCEAVVFPTLNIIAAMWWTRKEQPIRIAIYFNTLSSIFTGILAYGVGHTNTKVAPWRLLFIVLGVVSLLVWGMLFALLPSSPVDAWWLSEREKYICIERVRNNNTGMESKRIKWAQVRECLMDPKPWLLTIFSCAQNIANGGLVTFAAQIVKGLGYTTLQTTLIGIPTGVVGTIWQIILCYVIYKIGGYRCGMIFFSNLFTITCAVLMFKLPDTHVSKVHLLGPYYGFYSYWAPYVISTSLCIANVSGHTKKVTASAMFFIGYCVGNILGPQVFRAKDAPKYHNGYVGILACLCVASTSIAIYGYLCYTENRRRDKLQHRQEQGAVTSDADVSEETAFSDRTDKEKPEFRYQF